MTKITILGVFFDGYRDLWVDFLNLFRKYWPDCRHEFVIISNIDTPETFSGVRVLNAGSKAEFSQKIRFAIDNLDSDYYLVLLEDFFFSKKVDGASFDSLIEYIDDKHIKYYVMPMSDFSHNYGKCKKVIGRDGERFLSNKSEYTLNCQPSIWEKSFLKECVGAENYNAWVFEGIFSKINKKYKSIYTKNCVVSLNNQLSLLHGVIQGKMLSTTFDEITSNGYSFNNARELVSKSEIQKRNMKVLLRTCLPYSFRKFIKKIFKPKSIIESYESIIEKIIKSRWGDDAC